MALRAEGRIVFAFRDCSAGMDVVHRVIRSAGAYRRCRELHGCVADGPRCVANYGRMMRTYGIEREFIPCWSVVLRLWTRPQATWIQYCCLHLVRWACVLLEATPKLGLAHGWRPGYGGLDSCGTILLALRSGARRSGTVVRSVCHSFARASGPACTGEPGDRSRDGTRSEAAFCAVSMDSAGVVGMVSVRHSIQHATGHRQASKLALHARNGCTRWMEDVSWLGSPESLRPAVHGQREESPACRRVVSGSADRSRGEFKKWSARKGRQKAAREERFRVPADSVVAIDVNEIDGELHEEGMNGFAGNDPEASAGFEAHSAEKAPVALRPAVCDFERSRERCAAGAIQDLHWVFLGERSRMDARASRIRRPASDLLRGCGAEEVVAEEEDAEPNWHWPLR